MAKGKQTIAQAENPIKGYKAAKRHDRRYGMTATTPSMIRNGT